MLRPVSEDLFVLDVPFRIGGMELGGRMTVIRLPDGGLWLHSPVKLDAAARSAVEALGPVRFLVAPNTMHHLALGDWAAAYPSAKVLAPAGLRQKRKVASGTRRRSAVSWRSRSLVVVTGIPFHHVSASYYYRLPLDEV